MGAWVEGEAEWLIGLISGRWEFAAHRAIAGVKWVGANLMESTRILCRFSLMSQRSHALIVVAGAWLQPGRACVGPNERTMVTKENIDGNDEDKREEEDRNKEKH